MKKTTTKRLKAMLTEKPKRYFYPRPCDGDETPPGWCVAEVSIGPDGAKWESSLYAPMLARLAAGDPSIELVRMTKTEATKEARLWNEREANGGKWPACGRAKKKARTMKVTG
jgi:hypothetical protein